MKNQEQQPGAVGIGSGYEFRRSFEFRNALV